MLPSSSISSVASRTCPLVTVVTPVYNGEPYLAECIESVLKQSYNNWQYFIVNNCSTDSSLEIANGYAKRDARIHVRTNPAFVDAISNHNIAVKLISAESKYCKVIAADDWITPDCLSKMVELVEECPGIGLIGSYQSAGAEVEWKGLPPDVRVISGREVCRLSLLENLNVFGSPTSSLYRSELIRKCDMFFPHLLPHADTSACYEHLQNHDYGFVHEVLSIERIHEGQRTTKVKALDMGTLAYLDIVLKYGPIYLTKEEFEQRKIDFFESYYRALGGCLLQMKGRDFWGFQTSRLTELGYRMPWGKVIKGAVKEVLEEMRRPRVAYGKLLQALRGKNRTLFGPM
ncbi:MAG TPA: glycosyltransferase family 2 protein [Candidatus Acidoferrum sp.]|jgi:glycosyltransferase involved in cell wall biosynthesis|nr:glycosyltransferase family 2 protein [Candidatus Acidoferrum sp.]